jgi:hypothetical protein
MILRWSVIAALMGGLILAAACLFLVGAVPAHAKQEKTRLAILSHGDETGKRVVAFELDVPPGRRIVVKRCELVVDWGTSESHYGPPEWVQSGDPAGKFFEPGTKTLFKIVEPAERLRRMQFEIMEFQVGLRVLPWKLQRFWQTKRLSAFNSNPAPKGVIYVESGLISSYGSEPAHAANPR